jgi:hypothetical protein
MARMTRTIISLPEEEKRWLADYGKRHRMSGAQVVRLAVGEFRGREPEGAGAGADMRSVREEHVSYGPPPFPDLADMAEMKRRAAAAAGRFESGMPDLSVGHDRYLTAEVRPGKSKHRGKDKPGTDRPGEGGGRRTR